MSKPEIVPSSLYPAIYQFLSENKLNKTLKAFKKETSTTSENSEWNLMELLNSYVATHKSNASKQTVDKVEQENGHDKQKDKKDKKKERKEKKKENKRKKEEPEETPTIASPPVQEPKAKKQKTEPVVEKEKEPEVEESKEDKKKKKKDNKRKREEEKVETPKENGSTPAQEEKEAEPVPVEASPINSPKGGQKNKKAKNEPFRRVKSEEITVDSRLQNNDFTAKGGDDWGKKAWNELKVVKGKDFRHAKTKRKKGYRPGGQLDMGVNSVKFEYTDEE